MRFAIVKTLFTRLFVLQFIYLFISLSPQKLRTDMKIYYNFRELEIF